MACSTPPIVQLPQAGRRAVPDIFLGERPQPVPLTEQEFEAIPITAQGKIIQNQVNWIAYADVADVAIQGYREFITNLVGGETP